MFKRICLPVILLLTLLAGGPVHAQTLINGAGATFPYPLYSKWFDVYTKVNPAVRFNYQSIGSGGGIKQLINRTVDFGASDAPMSDQQLADAPARLFHFPTVLGGVVITYNLPGFAGKLRMTGPIIADIYLGKITKWNDPALAKLNPGIKLPDTDMVVCHRSDGSGTTYIFTDYLSKVSPAWRSRVGRDTSVRWPAGLGGKGNEGVSALVEQTPGAIGYVELIYAVNNKLPYAELQNHAGAWIDASLKSITAAAGSAKMPPDFRTSITDAPGVDAYPLSSFTYLLVYQKQTDATKGKAIVGFLQWMMTTGQQYAPALHYAPLPATVVQAEEAQLKHVTVP